MQFEPAAKDAFSERMFALIGLGYQELRRSSHIEWPRLLPYLGLLSIKVQSAAVLESVLRYYFNHKALFIEQCVVRRVTIPAEQWNQLGLVNHRLGQSLVLGESILDRHTTFRIHIRELDWDTFHFFFCPLAKAMQYCVSWWVLFYGNHWSMTSACRCPIGHHNR